jgi:hypothetical protein
MPRGRLCAKKPGHRNRRHLLPLPRALTGLLFTRRRGIVGAA